MMATKDDIKTFIVANAPTVVTAATLGAISAYSGQTERLNPDNFEVRAEYQRPSPVRRDTGQTRHEFTLLLTSRDWDESNEDGLTNELETAADEVIAAYDGKLSVFVAGLPAVAVERVRCFRPSKPKVEGFRRREIVLTFELDEMES
jgi:hypothetical protein